MVVSGAFPRFSTMNHALAASARSSVAVGRVHARRTGQVEPSGSEDIDLQLQRCVHRGIVVQRKNEGHHARFLRRQRRRWNARIEVVMVCETSGTNSRVSDSPLAGANVQPSGSWSLVCARVHEAVRSIRRP